jgi:hypothetical protein
VTRVPNLSLFVHTSCYEIDLELTDDDSTDLRLSVDRPTGFALDRHDQEVTRRDDTRPA